MRIGIDLGGTKIEGIILPAQGNIVKRLRLPTPKGDYWGTLQCIVELVALLEQELPSDAGSIPVGIAAPGSLSTLTGCMKNCNSTCLNGKPLRQDLELLLGREVRLANDADCFALSEAIDGAAAGFLNVFGVILGTGVGGGIVVDGQLLSGPNGIAGEWGHNPMPSSGLGDGSLEARDCYCGRKNCIEAHLSGPALAQRYFEQTGQQLPVEAIVKRANEGQSEALTLMDAYQEGLAAALATVINVLDPQAVVLGGGLSNIDSFYLELPKRWEKYVFSDSCETALLKAKYGDSSGVRGAAWLWP